MRLTDAQYWSGMLVLLLVIAVLDVGFLMHWRKIDRDTLRDDRRRLNAWARSYAEQLAKQLFREYVMQLRVNMPIELINESDIDWGEGRRENNK